MKSVFHRLVSFSGLSLLSALVPLMVLPVVARVGGEVAWATIGVGQAVGSLVGTFSYLSWGVAGPAKVAIALDSKLRSDIYAASYWSRLTAFVVVEVVGCVIAGSLAPRGQEPLAALTTISTGLTGLSIAWFAVGTARPRVLAMFEVVPRLVSSIAAIVAVALTREVWAYPVLIICGTCSGLCAYHIASFRRIFPPWIAWKTQLRGLRQDAAAAGVNFVGSGFSVLPVPLAASIGSIIDTARFSSADRLYRYSLFTITSLANSLQPWVLDPNSPRRLRRRQKIATRCHMILGLLGGGGLALFGRPVSALLFGTGVAASEQIMACYGTAFAAVCISTPYIQNILVPLGKSNLVLIATLCGVSCGIATMIVFFGHLSPLVLAASLAVNDIVTMTIIIYAALRANRESGGSFRSSPMKAGVDDTV